MALQIGGHHLERFFRQRVNFIVPIEHYAKSHTERRRIVLMAPRVTVQGLLVEPAAGTLRADGSHAFGSEGTLEPRQHELVVDSGGVVEHYVRWIGHVMEVEGLLIGAEVVEHVRVRESAGWDLVPPSGHPGFGGPLERGVELRAF